MKTTLHHFSYNIAPNSLELVIEFFEIFGCRVSYREGDARWCVVEQEPIPIDIQIIEVDDEIILIDKKINTHIAFLSDNPKQAIAKIEEWAKEKNIKFKKGGWSDEMLWFDLSEIFVNFVIEIMDIRVVSGK